MTASNTKDSASVNRDLQEKTPESRFKRRSKTFCLLFLFMVGGYFAFSILKTNDGYPRSDKRFQDTRHKPHSPCNCYSSQKTNISPHCCERMIWRSHKFGTILVGDLFANFRKTSSPTLKIRAKPTPKSSNYSLAKYKRDYRHVMVTRDWFDAIVSGYLYHKAGYECYIDFRGKDVTINRTEDWDMELNFHNKFWDTQLEYHEANGIYYPPRNNRSLCHYLQQESDEDGIKVIIDIALSWWYKGVIPYYLQAQEQLKQTHRRKSLFLCYEHLVNPFEQEATFHRMLKHFFPGRNTSSMHMPIKMKTLLIQQQQNHSIYQGGHASTHDAEVRTRLRNLVVQFDQELFDNTVATSNAVFKCGQSV